MHFFKTRFFCVLLVIALVLTIVPAVCTATGHTYILKNLVNTLITPLGGVVSSVGDALSGYGRYFSALKELKDENDALRAELNEYKKRVDELQDASRDYEWLSAYLGMKTLLEKSECVRAEICQRSDVSGIFRYTLNVGSIHGIKKDMAVICGGGVYGKITEVGLNWATVSTPLDSVVGFSVCVQRTGERGFTVGDYTITSDGLFRVKMVSADKDVTVGDTIVSVGSEALPDGITLGTVEKIEYNEYDRSTEALVRPSVDYNNEYAVIVVTKNEYEIIDVVLPNEEETGSEESVNEADGTASPEEGSR